MTKKSIRKNPKDNFDEWFKIAAYYYKKHNNLLVPANYLTEDGKKLGEWIIYIRTKYNSDNPKITKEQKEMLDSIGMVWNLYDYRWQAKFNQVKKFYDEYGTIELLPTYQGKEGLKHLNWIKFQRNIYYSKSKKPKDLEKIAKLESIGIICHHKDEMWVSMYNLAFLYYKKNNNLLIPACYETTLGKKLGIWIRNQRKSYSDGNLSAIKIAALESIGMVWHVYENKWNLMYKEALTYYQKYHTLSIYKDYKPTYVTKEELCQWLATQKIYYKQHKNLTLEQYKKLNLIKIDFDYQEDNWNYMYNLATNYYLENGHLLIPRTFKSEGKNLGIWLESQRQHYQKQKLSEAKILLLESIGIIWQPRKNLSSIYNYLDENYPLIDKRLNRDVLNRISLLELIAKINYLICCKHTSFIYSNGLLKDIFSMSSIAIKNDPNYGISLEEIINTYGKEYILKYNKNMKGKTLDL